MPVRVFVSYAHDNEDHKAQVLRFCGLLRKHGIDAHVDRYDANVRRDWHAWMVEQITAADYVLAIASPHFQHAADGNVEATRNRGVQSEAALLRDLLHSDRPTWTQKLLPIVLPGNTIDDIPHFLQPHGADHYVIPELSLAGIEHLLRTITGQPRHKMPDLGDPPDLPPEDLEPAPKVDTKRIARRLRRLSPRDRVTEFAGLAPADAALALVALSELDKSLASEMLDESDPAVAAQALHELTGLAKAYIPGSLIRSMRPERVTRLLIRIREGVGGVPPKAASTLLSIGGPRTGGDVLDQMEPDESAFILLGVADDDPGGLRDLLENMLPARAAATLARMTHEQAADLLTRRDGWTGDEFNSKVLMAMAPEQRINILNVTVPKVTADALERLSTADAGEILRALPESRGNRVLRRLGQDYARKMRVDEALAEMRLLGPAAASTVLTRLSVSDGGALLQELDEDTAGELLNETEPGPAAAMLYELGRSGYQPPAIMPLMDPDRVARMIVAVHENRTDLAPQVVPYYLRQLEDGSGGPVLDAIDAEQVATMLVEMSQLDVDQAANLLAAMTSDNAVEVIRRMGVRATAGVLNSWYSQELATMLCTHLEHAEVAGIVGFLSTEHAVRLLYKMEPEAVANILSAVRDGKADRIRRHLERLPGFHREPEPPDSDVDEEPDAEGIARRFSRLDPVDTAAEFAGLTPKDAARLLTELTELGADLAAELLDETEPTFAAQVLHELDDLAGRYLPSRLLTLMRPEPAALLLVTIREGHASGDPDLATRLLTAGDGVPVPDGMDPDEAAALLLGVFDEDPSGLARVLRTMNPAWLVTVLARMTREQAADVLTGNGDNNAVNAAVLMAMPPDLRADVLGLMGPAAAAEALAELAVTDTIEILRHLPESRVNRLFRRFPWDYAAKMRANQVLDELSQGKPADLSGMSATDAVYVLRELDKRKAARVLEEIDVGLAATLLAETMAQWHLMDTLPAMRPERLAEIMLAIYEGRTEVEPTVALLLLGYHMYFGVDGPVLDVLDTDQAASILVALSQWETRDGYSGDVRAPYVLAAMTPARAVEAVRRMGAEQAADLFNRGFQPDTPRVAAELFAHLEQAEVDEIVSFLTPSIADRLREH